MTTSDSPDDRHDKTIDPRDRLKSVAHATASADNPRNDPGVEAHRRLSAGKTFEVVRRDGEEEMARPATSLALHTLIRCC